MSQLAQGLSQLGAAAGEISKNSSGNPVEPVDFRKLVALLPEVPGWQKGELEGEHMTGTFGYERVTNTGGNLTYEKWDKNEQSAEFMVLVNRRFIWYLKGGGVTDPNVLQEIASKIDLGTLSSMH